LNTKKQELVEIEKKVIKAFQISHKTSVAEVWSRNAFFSALEENAAPDRILELAQTYYRAYKSYGQASNSLSQLRQVEDAVREEMRSLRNSTSRKQKEK
jgi:uncharacterized protein HemY